MTVHASNKLPGITVTSYSLTLTVGGGFIGDRANSQAFFSLLDTLREPLRESGTDPFAGVASGDLTKDDIDEAWRAGDAFAAGLVHTTIEEFAQRLASVVRAYRRYDKNWAKVTRIVVGGGLRDSRIGEIAIGRTTAILRLEGVAVDLVPITQDPDEAALLGGLRLIEAERFSGSAHMLAVDIGGSSIRAGLIAFDPDQPHDITRATVMAFDQWKYSEEIKQPSRDEAVSRLAEMLEKLEMSSNAKLARLITIACPGRIHENGDIRDGAHNLPGDWEAEDFNLPHVLSDALRDRYEIVLHNDAVVQGLSEAAAMAGVEHWAIVTIGTGLGNATYASSLEAITC